MKIITTVTESLSPPQCMGGERPCSIEGMSPTHRYLDRCYSGYTNFKVNKSTNCIEGLILGLLQLPESHIRTYAQGLKKDGQLIKEVELIAERDYKFLVAMLDELTK